MVSWPFGAALIYEEDGRTFTPSSCSSITQLSFMLLEERLSDCWRFSFVILAIPPLLGDSYYYKIASYGILGDYSPYFLSF